ncbi:pilin [Haloechinothrix salitolerans]|uniref:Pilin n=1 Tax=Haloechinothrix salitolerans TaxID=926830 RepID=A0ABW2BV95_9PSEU
MRSLAPGAGPAAGGRALRRRIGRILIITALVTAGLLATAAVASAEAVQVVALARSINEILRNIRSWLMGILALLATVFLTIGGVRYVLANGDPSEIERAKQSFKSAGFGYALAALAPLVVEILRGIVGA